VADNDAVNDDRHGLPGRENERRTVPDSAAEVVSKTITNIGAFAADLDQVLAMIHGSVGLFPNSLL
jgi:hypothetical protein